MRGTKKYCVVVCVIGLMLSHGTSCAAKPVFTPGFSASHNLAGRLLMTRRQLTESLA